MTTLVRRNRNDAAPWNALREIEDHFSQFFADPFGPMTDWSNGGSGWAPAIDLSENENEYVIDADIPGVSKDDITLELLDNVVTIKGERKSEKKEEDKKKGYHRVERTHGSFQRSVQIPGGFKSDAVQAKFNNGVLRITLPKPEESKPRTITVQPS